MISEALRYCVMIQDWRLNTITSGRKARECAKFCIVEARCKFSMYSSGRSSSPAQELEVTWSGDYGGCTLYP